MARALATRPRLLLLDEVTGGVDQRSHPRTWSRWSPAPRGGATLIVIEHNMRVIMASPSGSSRSTSGEKIADGPPAGCRARPPGRRGLPRRAPMAAVAPRRRAAGGRRPRRRLRRLPGPLGRRARACEPGEIVALLGPNGAGKSTLMNTSPALVRRRDGTDHVSTAGASTAARPRSVGLGLAHVLERRRLFPYLTVRQNVLLGAYHPAARPTAPRPSPEVERSFPCSGSAGTSPPTRCPGASSRWWRSREA